MEESSYRYTTCILKVNTQTSGWEKSLTKVIKSFEGVSYTIDALQGIVRISGRIDPNKVLNDIKKAGKHAELIHVDCGDGNQVQNHHSSRAHEDGYAGDRNNNSNRALGYGYDGGYVVDGNNNSNRALGYGYDGSYGNDGNYRSNRAMGYGYDGGYRKMEHQQHPQFYDMYHDAGHFIEPSAPPQPTRHLLLPPPNAPADCSIM